MKRFLISFGVFVAVLVFANLAMAGTIDVDSNDSCTDGTQDNLVPTCSNLTIWWNGTGSPNNPYCAQLWNGKNLLDSQQVDFVSSCGNVVGDLDVDFATCAGGSLRVKVCEGGCPCTKSSKNTGGDSFRTESN